MLSKRSYTDAIQLRPVLPLPHRHADSVLPVPTSWRRVILLVASYFFYASWNWRFIPLLLSLTIIDYFCAQWIVRTEAAKRKLAMIISVAANLGFLGFFKYYNFLASNVAILADKPETRSISKSFCPWASAFIPSRASPT